MKARKQWRRVTYDEFIQFRKANADTIRPVRRYRLPPGIMRQYVDDEGKEVARAQRRSTYTETKYWVLK